MPTPINLNVSRAVDENGDAVAGALAYFYASGTTTPITVYADEGQTTPHEWPVVADAEGVFPAVYFEDASFKVTVKDAEGVTLAGYPVEVRGGADLMSPEDVEITGGTIDGATIGGTTPAAITGTNITATGALSGDDLTITGDVTGVTGRLINIQKFTASGTYTPTAGTSFAIIQAVGATGAGGGADSDTSGTSADGGVGGGAAGGGTVIVKADVSAGGYSATIVIGAGGTGVSQDQGGAGGDTSFDDGTNSFTIPGTDGGTATVDNINVNFSVGSEGVSPTVTGFEQVILSVPGADGDAGLSIPNNAVNAVGKVIGGKSGGSALFGGGRRGAGVSSGGVSNAGLAARFPGEGGSGAASMGEAAPVAGGDGFRGEITIYEYSA